MATSLGLMAQPIELTLGAEKAKVLLRKMEYFFYEITGYRAKEQEKLFLASSSISMSVSYLAINFCFISIIILISTAFFSDVINLSF